MNAEVLLYVATGAILVFWFYYLIRRRWNLPSEHGPGFFMGIEVASDAGRATAPQWTSRYHAFLVVEHSLIVLAAAWLVAAGLWRWLPAWGGGTAVVDLAATRCFLAWARRSIPVAARPEATSTVALSLEVRRLGDYLSWVSEALLATVLLASWVLLVTRGSQGWRWQEAAVWTYIAITSSLWKVYVIRSGVPLPADRTEEHHRWLDGRRRHGVRVLDCGSWFAALLVAGYAALHSSPGDQAAIWIKWTCGGLAGSAWTVMAVVIARGERRLATTGQTIRPVESWRGLSAPGHPSGAHAGMWSVAFAVGLIVLIALNFLGS